MLTLTFVLWTRRVEDGYLPLKPAPFVNTATTYANLVRYIMHECSYYVNGSSACSSLIICLTFVHALVLKEGYIALTAWSAANSLKLFKRRPKLHIQEEIGFLVCELWSSHFFLQMRMPDDVDSCLHACIGALKAVDARPDELLSSNSWCMHACLVNIYTIDVKRGACRFCDVEWCRLHWTGRGPYFIPHAWW